MCGGRSGCGGGPSPPGTAAKRKPTLFSMGARSGIIQSGTMLGAGKAPPRDDCLRGASSGRKLPAAMGGVAFQHADRIERFLRGAQRMGVPKVSLFEVPALLEAADMPAVVVCLSGLARCTGAAPDA